MNEQLSLEVVVSHVPLSTEVNTRRNNNRAVTLPARLKIDPRFVGVGASWRFTLPHSPYREHDASERERQQEQHHRG